MKVTYERVREALTYDPETGVLTWRIERQNRHIGDIAGFLQVDRSGKSYTAIGLDNKFYFAHRIAWLYTFGQWPIDEIDHINGNGQDNRLVNLREVSHGGNNKNKRLPITNTSGYVGVHWDKRGRKWRASIKVNGHPRDLGGFDNKVDAAEAAKKAREEHGFHPNHGTERPL